MRIIFAMKETVMNRYSVEVPKKLKNSSDEELLEWVNSGDVFNEPIEFEKKYRYNRKRISNRLSI